MDSIDELDMYEAEKRLKLYKEYENALASFPYYVETELRAYLADKVDVEPVPAAGGTYFKVTLVDAWITSMTAWVWGTLGSFTGWGRGREELIGQVTQALAASHVPNKLQIGHRITKGLGAGSDPAVGLAVPDIGDPFFASGILNGVFGLAPRTEHAVGDMAQPGSLGLELLLDQILPVHRSHSLVRLRHGCDERDPGDVTRRRFVDASKNGQPGDDHA